MPKRTSTAVKSASKTAQLSSERRRVDVDIDLCSGNRLDAMERSRMDRFRFQELCGKELTTTTTGREPEGPDAENAIETFAHIYRYLCSMPNRAAQATESNVVRGINGRLRSGQASRIHPEFLYRKKT